MEHCCCRGNVVGPSRLDGTCPVRALARPIGLPRDPTSENLSQFGNLHR